MGTVRGAGRQTARPVNRVADFFADAVAIEREAAARYEEFARHMKDQAQDTAELFSRMARQGLRHARDLSRRTGAARVAPGAHAWLDQGAPQPAAHEWVFRLMSPRCALEIAMHAEQRAKRYFEHVVRTTGDKQVRAVAQEFLNEEGEHIARMRRALIKLPNPMLDWEKIYESGGPLAGPAKSAKPGKPAAAKKLNSGKAPAKESKVLRRPPVDKPPGRTLAS